jgi:hypothetical protein
VTDTAPTTPPPDTSGIDWEALGEMLVYADDFTNGPLGIFEHGSVRWPLDGSGPVVVDTDEHSADVRQPGDTGA